MTWIDKLFLIIAGLIWVSLIYNLILMYFGYRYFLEIDKIKKDYLENMTLFPLITILIPCHNEETVIEETLRSINNLNYPKNKLQVIAINDNSSDKTKEVIEKFIWKPGREHMEIINVPKEQGGKGKSGALNYGVKKAKGEYIVVYDADNTPEEDSLRYLVKTITAGNYAAVVGKFRTRNKNKNLLTEMINIEGISYQWLAQGGRWELFNLNTIPGTNYIISKKDLDEVGGYDPGAIAEDTEISIKLYRIGKKIRFMPLAVTWEQEPETLKVFFKQRLRWIKGNLYVLFKYIFTNPFRKNNKYYADIINFFVTYIAFLFAVVLSHMIFLINIIFGISLTIKGNINIIWLLTFILYILQVSNTLSLEKGELNKKNFAIIILSYFTYTQLWLWIAVVAFFQFLKDQIILKKEVKWYKTERF